MKTKIIIFFVLALAVSFLAANWRWGDSAHSIGLIKASGGEARHPAFLESGKDSYMLIATATVIPPYRGNARVVLEGEPRLEHKIYFSGPAMDLGLRRNPEFRNNVLYNLEPKDSIALWVEMKPPRIDPVCGMIYEEGFKRISYQGKEYVFCAEGCADAFLRNPEKYMKKQGVRGKYHLAFYDTKTSRSVLDVPIVFRGKGGVGNAGHHEH